MPIAVKGGRAPVGGAMKLAQSLRVGLRSVRMNSVPMAVLWSLAGVLVLGYYRSPQVSAAVAPVARWQTESGWIAAALNRVVFCGLLPGCFLVAMPSLRPPKVAWTVAAYCLWGGLWGVACDAFFKLQTAVFGGGHDLPTLVGKVLVDQLVWNVLVCMPANALFFPWVESGFVRLGSVRRGFLSMLIANWIVWAPVMVAVYAFPLPLQVQLVGLAGSLWMLVALRSGRR